MMLVPTKIERGESKVCQETFLHDFICEVNHDNDNLHLPTANLTLVQKGVLYCRSEIYNKLPAHIKDHSEDLKYFKSKLKSFHIEHTLYRFEEFYQETSNDYGSC